MPLCRAGPSVSSCRCHNPFHCFGFTGPWWISPLLSFRVTENRTCEPKAVPHTDLSQFAREGGLPSVGLGYQGLCRWPHLESFLPFGPWVLQLNFNILGKRKKHAAYFTLRFRNRWSHGSRGIGWMLGRGREEGRVNLTPRFTPEHRDGCCRLSEQEEGGEGATWFNSFGLVLFEVLQLIQRAQHRHSCTWVC